MKIIQNIKLKNEGEFLRLLWKHLQKATDMGLISSESIIIKPNVQVGVNNTNEGIIYRDYP